MYNTCACYCEPFPSSTYYVEYGGIRDGRRLRRRPSNNIRTFNIRYRAKLVASLSVQFFMLASCRAFPWISCENCSFCRGRAYSAAAFLAASFLSASVQRIAVALVAMCHLAPSCEAHQSYRTRDTHRILTMSSPGKDFGSESLLNHLVSPICDQR